MKISSTGRAFIEGFESLVLYPYDDKVPPIRGVYPEWKGGTLIGTATIGFGHTDEAKYPLKVVPGLKITAQQADEILDVDLDDCEKAVNDQDKVPLTQGQFDALTSFTFNCGAGALAKLIAHGLNRSDYGATRAALDLYVYSAGEYMYGLQRRRDGEQALWDSVPVLIPAEPTHYGAEVDEPVDWFAIQTGLKDLGLYLGDVDGDPGKLTREAIWKLIKKGTKND